MKIDSLSIEIASFIKSSREKGKKLREYNDVLNNLVRIDANKADYRILMLSDSGSASIEEITTSTSKLTKLFDHEISERLSSKKRESLLSAFEKLGYVINEDMETAFVKNGRLVVNKNSGANYGVELGSPSSLQRIQLRVVSNQRNSHENTTADDIRAEEAWCEDFRKIKADFVSQGLFIEIDRQLEPGEASIKKVEFENNRWKSSSRKLREKKNKTIDH